MIWDRCRVNWTGRPETRSLLPAFCSDGSYNGFDRSAPTSSDGGKARVVASLQAELGAAASPLVMIGDGVTDMQV